MTIDVKFCVQLGHEHAQDNHCIARSQGEAPTIEKHRALLDNRTLQGLVTIPDAWRTIGDDDVLWHAYREAFERRFAELAVSAA